MSRSFSLAAMALRFVNAQLLQKNIVCGVVQRIQVRCKTFNHPGTPAPDQDLHFREGKGPIAKEEARYPGEFDLAPAKGKIFDKKPFRMELEAGKKYSWCTCGHSHKQPLCDGNHKTAEGTTFKKSGPKFRPLRFEAEETKEYWLCNCKQTNNPPFCDGTHKREDIQEKIRS